MAAATFGGGVSGCGDAAAPETWSITKEGSTFTESVVGKVAVPGPSVLLTVNGTVRAGVPILWSTTSGSVSGVQSLTNGNGSATILWTMGTVPGVQTLVATGPEGTSPVQFTATAVPDRPAIVRFAPDSVVMDVLGDSVKLAPLVTDQYENASTVTATFSVDTSFVVLTASGYVRSVENGTALVTATADSARGVLRVIVRQVPVASVRVSPDSASLLVGDSLLMTAAAFSAENDTLNGRAFIWTTLDSSVVTVSATGVVTALDSGLALIIATSEEKSDTARLRALTRIATITVSPESATVVIGQSHQLIATLRDAEGGILTGRVTTWTSSDEAQVTVSTTGLVEALKPGVATITVEAEDKSASATITAAEIVPGGAIAAGIGSATCGLTLSGDAYCWGLEETAPNVRERNFSPVRIVGGHTFTAIARGQLHTVALTPDGDAYAWGANARQGRLGNGVPNAWGYSAVPVLVHGGLKFATITAGQGHTCGLTPAGKAYCWGDNANRQIGTGESLSWASTPEPVFGDHIFVAISAGMWHTVALTADGEAYAWGGNQAGQIGDGGSTIEYRQTPVKVAGGLRFQKISAGVNLTVALTAEGVAHHWGAVDGVQLTPSLVPGGTKFTSIAAGGAGYGLTSEGVVYA